MRITATIAADHQTGSDTKRINMGDNFTAAVARPAKRCNRVTAAGRSTTTFAATETVAFAATMMQTTGLET